MTAIPYGSRVRSTSAAGHPEEGFVGAETAGNDHADWWVRVIHTTHGSFVPLDAPGRTVEVLAPPGPGRLKYDLHGVSRRWVPEAPST